MNYIAVANLEKDHLKMLTEENEMMDYRAVENGENDRGKMEGWITVQLKMEKIIREKWKDCT